MGRFDKLPGIDGENTRRRNVLIGSGYAVGGLVVLGAVLPEGEEGGDDPEPNGDDDDDDTQQAGLGNGDDDDGTEEPDEGEGGDDDPPADEDADDEPEEPEESTLESVRADGDLWDSGHDHFSGDTQSVETISIGGMFTVFSFSHEGDGNFQITVMQDGDRVGSAANEIGEVDGVRGFGLENGEYQLEINANGPWELTVAQPLPPDEEIHLPPANATGDTHDVVGPIELSGGETVTGSHEGDANFIVHAWDEDATDSMGREGWFNEIGQHEGQVVNSSSGIRWIAVQANGAWELEIE